MTPSARSQTHSAARPTSVPAHPDEQHLRTTRVHSPEIQGSNVAQSASPERRLHRVSANTEVFELEVAVQVLGHLDGRVPEDLLNDGQRYA